MFTQVVTDGNTAKEQSLSGNHRPGDIHALHGSFLITFTSDAITSGVGFYAEYSVGKYKIRIIYVNTYNVTHLHNVIYYSSAASASRVRSLIIIVIFFSYTIMYNTKTERTSK